MAGPGIRYHRLAIELAQRFEVTLVAPGGGIPAVPYIFRSAESVSSASDVEADVVVAQSLPLGLIRSLHRAGIRLVFDLYAPALVEAAANLAEERSADRSDGIRYEEVVAVTPFGLDPAPPSSGSPLVKGVLPGIGTDDRLLLWGGGVWNWFDPLTVIRAVGRLSESRSDVKLLFLGMKHPSSAVAEMTMADRAIALAAELDLDGSSVFFNRDWVPYDERLAWFAEADLGVSAHRDSFEARLAFRTRLLDHIAVGTPLVVTQGDVLGDLVQSRGMGRALAPSDVDGWAVALAGLLDDDRAYAAAKTAVKAAREELSWGRIGEPLAELIERVASTPRQRSSGGGVLLRAAATMARSSLDRRGLRATLAAASRAISGSARR